MGDGWHRTYSSPTRAALLADMAKMTTRVSAARTELCRDQRQIMKPSKSAPKDALCGRSLEEMGRRCVLVKGCVLTIYVPRYATFWWRVSDGSDRDAPFRQAEAAAQTSLPHSHPKSQLSSCKPSTAAQCKQASRTAITYNYGPRTTPEAPTPLSGIVREGRPTETRCLPRRDQRLMTPRASWW